MWFCLQQTTHWGHLRSSREKQNTYDCWWYLWTFCKYIVISGTVDSTISCVTIITCKKLFTVCIKHDVMSLIGHYPYLFWCAYAKKKIFKFRGCLSITLFCIILYVLYNVWRSHFYSDICICRYFLRTSTIPWHLYQKLCLSYPAVVLLKGELEIKLTFVELSLWYLLINWLH